MKLFLTEQEAKQNRANATFWGLWVIFTTSLSPGALFFYFIDITKGAGLPLKENLQDPITWFGAFLIITTLITVSVWRDILKEKNSEVKRQLPPPITTKKE